MLAVKQKIFAFVFALLCLFSSAQFVLNQHFCCNQLVQISISGVNNDCCGTKTHCHSEKSSKDADCCDDKEILVEGEDFLGNLKIDLPSDDLVQFVGKIAFEKRHVSQNNMEDYTTYPPPDNSNLHTKFCVFRI